MEVKEKKGKIVAYKWLSGMISVCLNKWSLHLFKLQDHQNSDQNETINE